MKERDLDLNGRIARRVRELRAGRGISLQDLAKKSGVSRSMISLIERGESSSTAVVLEKLAAGLNVTLGSLFEGPDAVKEASGPVARREEQVVWRDPGSGYVRRNVSPAGLPQEIQIVEVEFPTGGRVAFEGLRDVGVQQQIWVLEGAIDVTVGKRRHRLETGDCLAMELDGPTMFHNFCRRTKTRYVVVSADSSGRKRR